MSRSRAKHTVRTLRPMKTARPVRTARPARTARRAKTPRSARTSRPVLAIVGAGRAGTALGLALVAAGWRIAGVASRNAGRARALARRLGATASGQPDALANRTARQGGVLLLAVPDREIEPLAMRLARAATGPPSRTARARRSPVALHLSGVTAAAALEALSRAGWRVGSLHPLVSFPPVAPGRGSGRGGAARAAARHGAARAGTPRAVPGPGRATSGIVSLAGVAFAVDGDPEAVRTARELVSSLQGWTVPVAAPARAGWHLAACLASNYVVTLAAEATALMSREAGLPARAALRALVPLLARTVANLDSSGLPAALTGPVARGDAATLARHAALLARRPGSPAALHAALVDRTIRLALAGGLLTPADARRLAASVIGASGPRYSDPER